MSNYQSAFDAFMTEAFEEACVSSTKASWGGSGYSVELLEDGNFGVYWDNQIGNKYKSPGIILGIPDLKDDEWDEENGHFFDNAAEEMTAKFEQVMADIAAYANA
jgi:hypothetical protein